MKTEKIKTITLAYVKLNVDFSAKFSSFRMISKYLLDSQLDNVFLGAKIALLLIEWQKYTII